MYDKQLRSMALVFAALLGGCSGPGDGSGAGPGAAASSVAQATKPVVVHDEMIGVVIPQTEAIWMVSNASMDDTGNGVASRMTPESWTMVNDAVTAVIASLGRLANSGKITVVTPGQKILDQDLDNGAKPTEVQARIDADVPGFQKHARDMAVSFDLIRTAVEKRDFATFYTKSLDLDGECEACHKAFWLKPAR